MKNIKHIPSVFLVDNYDSFTYNLVELLRVCGIEDIVVQKNDKVQYSDVQRCEKIIFSPGPSLPKDAPIMFRLLEKFGATKSILGVCLGHQAIGEYYGGKLYNMKRVVHGIRKKMHIQDKEGIFEHLPDSTYVGLYHSWAVQAENLPTVLTSIARTEEDIVMAFRHKTLDITGVQFHPESYMTEYSRQMLENWLGCGKEKCAASHIETIQPLSL